MGDAVLNVACEKVAKAAGSTGLGYLEVAHDLGQTLKQYQSVLDMSWQYSPHLHQSPELAGWHYYLITTSGCHGDWVMEEGSANVQ